MQNSATMALAISRPDVNPADQTQRERWHRTAHLGVAERPRDAGHWQERSLCKEFDPDVMFPHWQDLAGAEVAKAICAQCPVRQKCLEEALKSHQSDGIWGGEDMNPARVRLAERVARTARRRRAARSARRKQALAA